MTGLGAVHHSRTDSLTTEMGLRDRSALTPIATRKRTSRRSLDNLVGALLQEQRHVQPERFRRLKIDGRHEFRR
jgi:hypothetical protein